MKLYVKVMKPSLMDLYKKKFNYSTDCGFDCYSEPLVVPPNARAYPIMLGIMCEPSETRGYMLVPRSSITKTPLRLANSVGIIDPSYRGEIQARVDNLSDQPVEVGNVSLFQLINGDLSPMYVEFVEDLSQSERGDGGFGSTNTNRPIMVNYSG